ncbi:molybdopterin molybdochelatase [Jatrophihabitans sp. GAS493]|uniref:molybdopterin molybdotransferase MoeA n=1 Tax=Jatrophihabitans sp. GAS493 TaxID=1907575 RepID=UPI000BB947DA|nr:gephyrin-like molybdotransferase Glp [Jatrophihabitans sp. GAS493]SOD73844.1 molybdopterin molybdochelatase [Jatrophihabitans sp. GAS493]
MRTVSEHQALIAALIPRTRSVSLPLPAAAGRVLAADVVAKRPLPAFDNSAMDGYAVRGTEVASATRQAPVTLPVGADIPAGRVDTPELAVGTAHRIMTGAPVPVGADTIVQVEATDGGLTQVVIHETRTVGTAIRRAGEDVTVGETVLTAGTVLGAAHLGLLAALGEPSATVWAPVRVLVLSTGSELVAPGQSLLPGQIHESNTIMLATAVRACGAEAEEVHFVADDVDDLLAALQPHLDQTDLILTSGGVSAGAYEVVKDALADRGVDFVKVAMQPGMPQGAGIYAGISTVTLPGNPVSALVSFEVFLRPALRSAMGYSPSHRPLVRMPLAASLTSPSGRRQFRRGVVGDGDTAVETIGPPASHFLRWLAASNCLIDIPAEVVALDVGDLVDVWLID